MQVELTDASGTPVSHSRLGDSYGMGQQEFGFLRQELFFEQLSPDTRRLRLQIRGALGEWDIPLEMLPLGDTGVQAKVPDHAEQGRHGITVRLRGVVATDAETILDIEAVAAPPARSTLAIGSWPPRHKREGLLSLVDGRGGPDGENRGTNRFYKLAPRKPTVAEISQAPQS